MPRRGVPGGAEAVRIRVRWDRGRFIPIDLQEDRMEREQDAEQRADSLPDGAQSDTTGPENPGEDTNSGGGPAQPEKQ
jgi:hypothetical protein